MLQQTQVETVISYFNRFMSEIPNFDSLAQLDEERLFKLWEGLGYYSRAKNLSKCAKVVVSQYDSQLPCDVKALQKLPGIGPYTAGAIASIAFELPEPAIDGNVMRVMSRCFNMDCDIANPKNRVLFENKIRPYYSQFDEIKPSDMTQGLMELGALICTPKSPQCDQCPLCPYCDALSLNLVNTRPVKTPKKKQTLHQMAVALIECDNQILVTKRGEGLLSGLWGFPIAEGTTAEEAKKALIEVLETDYGMAPTTYECEVQPCKEVRHVFTHRIWTMLAYRCRVVSKLTLEYPEVSWIRKGESTSYALPTAFKKILK